MQCPPLLYLAHHGLPHSPSSKITIWSFLIVENTNMATMHTLNIAASKPERPPPGDEFYTSKNSQMPSYGLARPIRIDLSLPVSQGKVAPELVRVSTNRFPDEFNSEQHYDLAPTHILLGSVFLGAVPILQTQRGKDVFVQTLADALVVPQRSAVVTANKEYRVTQDWAVRAINRLSISLDLKLGCWLTREDLATSLDNEMKSRATQT